MPANALNAYKNNAVTTQTPGQIVVLLYEGAIRFLKQAIEALEQKQYAEKGRLINRTIDIISELNAALDMEKGGEVAVNLRKLYLFMQEHLLKANFQKSPEMVQEVITMLEELHGGWKEIAA
ncbi:MAG: flagellar export chaperone FliS [Planctomycetes bacterium]|jgi:flagellar protein FliS|nr:flagellar export chaperone FliS [Phycisphaerae bacterium]NBB94426.1 flagellar export chaperone FliS [Planctomycetota bacterium]